jgi:Ca2+/Na+ antiporter
MTAPEKSTDDLESLVGETFSSLFATSPDLASGAVSSSSGFPSASSGGSDQEGLGTRGVFSVRPEVPAMTPVKNGGAKCSVRVFALVRFWIGPLVWLSHRLVRQSLHFTQ